MVKKIWLLRSGALDLDRSVLLAGRGYGTVERVPVYAVLLLTGQGYVLVDTGQNPLGRDDPEGVWGQRAKLLVPVLTGEDDIRFRLAQLGVNPEEVRTVINTHLHWDHTGGNQFFPHAEILVQRAEYRFAFYPDSHLSASYMRSHFDHPLNYRLVEGDCQPLEGIRLLFTPGHTPGHQSVMVTMESGRQIIFAGDAVYTRENVELGLPSGNCWSGEASMASLRKLITISELTGAKLLPSHDPRPEFFTEAERIISDETQQEKERERR